MKHSTQQKVKINVSCTLTRDEPVTSRVACLTDCTLINGDNNVRYTRVSSLHPTLVGIQSALHLVLTLFFRFLTGMSRALGTLVSFSRAYRPSQTAHLMVFSFELAITKLLSGVTLSPSRIPENALRRLPLTLGSKSITTTSGCCKAPWSLRFPLEVAGIFTG